MAISLKQKIMDADINNLKKDIREIRDCGEWTSSRNEFLLKKVEEKLLVMLTIFGVLIFGLFFFLIYHNNSEDAHPNMQQHIYRDMSNYEFDLDKQLEARGWHKECVENEIMSYVNVTVLDKSYTFIYDSEKQTAKGEIEYPQNHRGDIDIFVREIYNTTFCTKYQLVTTQ